MPGSLHHQFRQHPVSEDAHALGRAVRWGQAEYIEDCIARGERSGAV